jgi:hypothetical protein
LINFSKARRGTLALPRCTEINRKGASKMMRNLKILGLALVAVFAMSSVAASMAAADQFTAEAYPTVLTGKTDPGAAADLFTTTTGNVNCKSSTYTGTVSAATTTVSMLPSYAECTAFGFPAVIDVNGCTYLFHVMGGSSTEGDVDLECTGGNQVTVTAIGAGTTKCTVHVGSQADITGTVKYINTGSGTTREVTLEVDIGGIDYSHTKGTGLGACTAGSATNGSLVAKGIVTGENEAGTAHLGVFMS